MRKLYEEPEIQIRDYKLPFGNIVMTSDPNAPGGDVDLEDGDLNNPWKTGNYFE